VISGILDVGLVDNDCSLWGFNYGENGGGGAFVVRL